jgi:hypothetical protein
MPFSGLFVLRVYVKRYNIVAIPARAASEQEKNCKIYIIYFAPRYENILLCTSKIVNKNNKIKKYTQT